jgi:hypothetical protein
MNTLAPHNPHHAHAPHLSSLIWSEALVNESCERLHCFQMPQVSCIFCSDTGSAPYYPPELSIASRNYPPETCYPHPDRKQNWNFQSFHLFRMRLLAEHTRKNDWVSKDLHKYLKRRLNLNSTGSKYFIPTMMYNAAWVINNLSLHSNTIK